MGATNQSFEYAAHTLYPGLKGRQDRFMGEVLKGHVPESVVCWLAEFHAEVPQRPTGLRVRFMNGRYRDAEAGKYIKRDGVGTLLHWGVQEGSEPGSNCTMAVIACDDGQIVVGGPLEMQVVMAAEEADEPATDRPGIRTEGDGPHDAGHE